MGLYQRQGFVPPLASCLGDHKSRIRAAVSSLDVDTLRDVWDEFNYRLDVVRAASEGHVEKFSVD